MRPLTLKGEEIYPSKVVCLIVNYHAHGKELDHSIPEMPLWFLKPPQSIIGDGESIILPELSSNVHHEVELAVVMGRGGSNIPKEEALDHVLGYTILLDITARDLQNKYIKEGRPWSICKGFDTFAPTKLDIVPKEMIKDPDALDIRLSINGKVRQDSNTRNMIFSVAEQISEISKITTFDRGDIIATGTPEGVGQIFKGDRLFAEIEGIGTLSVDVK
ncbi:MAG TPA: fumarylacetoacetate hydrolase family protein [Candidatus Methanofastidiosa archaeon]|nr:fumarylacetoacetate hydrolase family protein [Candidatus Methanofastidiosa archaeon]HPR41664.1 fumarylacetoacetate hydrolase family protein [Candidatus Methanofastidiosa archaeon]